MPFRPPRLTVRRLTVRRLMIVVALVAVVIGGGLEAVRLSRVSREYSIEVWKNGHWEKRSRKNGEKPNAEWLTSCRQIDQINQGGGTQMGRNVGFLGYPPPPEFWRRKAEYHRRLKEKYEHAARYPWLPVEPDPPEPAWDGVVRP